MRLLLGVTGSVAAYKAAELANRFTKDGHEVDVILTRAAALFVTPLTFQTLTRRKVYTDLFGGFDATDVRHVSLAQGADLALIAPATANLIGKLAGGLADDMLTTVLTAFYPKPALIAPAMNTAMYQNPIVQGNIAKLAGFGYRFIEPREGRLACGDCGKGALAETGDIVRAVYEAV
ncbi:MAG: phosphopantothenoylcysteine decarboxylase [Oscillospiraceae bacterium]|jgi:phosphopantothenoylcysteine decarboxylase/phosphopantothenoylcysteine decarboxylase/phosphopantothenate--cysteine ligase|nr:phosphopantothenoylcysteine decarboxylase [Oscillospiraceae bacterium]